MSEARQIEEQAALWLVRCEDTAWSSADQAELEQWLDASMAHKAAFWRLEHGWASVDRIAALGSANSRQPHGRLSKMRAWQGIATGMALAASVAFIFFASVEGPSSTVEASRFATTIGTRQLVPLTDGSKVELNTRTQLRTSVGVKAREVWLDQGEAYFDVAHRPDQPFIVHIGNRKVTVLGTKFSVRRDKDKVTISVLEGRVQLADPSASSTEPSVIIVAGAVAIARDQSIILTRRPLEQVDEMLAWRSGYLRFDQMMLGEAAAEFNRYNKRQIVITDANTAGIRIGGTFRANNVDAFARLLRDAYGLEITETQGVLKISEPHGDKDVTGFTVPTVLNEQRAHKLG